MRLTRDLAYDAAPAEVLAMLQDAAFWDRVAEATGAPSSSTRVTAEGDTVEVITDQQQVVAGVPAFARKFVGESTQAIITTTWRGQAATYAVDTPGKPTSIAGTATVRSHGDGSVLAYDLEVRASVPLVGGRLEKLVCELTGDGLDREHEVGRAWLAAR